MKKKIAIFFGVLAVLGLSVAYTLGFFSFKELALNPAEAEKTFPLVSTSFKDIRAVYMTAPVAQTPSWVNKIISLVASSSELNAVVVNVKDENGVEFGDWTEPLVVKLRAAGIYPIARIVVFQDNAFAKSRPDLALHDKDGKLWTADKGNYLWLDPASKEVWDRTVTLAEQALDDGFKEINFDYVRFPSDGDNGDPVYPVYDGKTSKEEVIKNFFEYLTAKVHKDRPGSILSADLFAYTFIENNGLGIGQLAGNAGKYFDVISPMVYPSHYTPGDFGFSNPAKEPYQVILQTLDSGKVFLDEASSTAVIRPWIQDFDLGAVYDAPMIKEEIQAIKDAGYGDTWMDWNPKNVYDSEKFVKQ